MKKTILAVAAMVALSGCAALTPTNIQMGVEAVKVGQALYCTFATPEGRKTVRKKLTGTETVLVDICQDASVPAEAVALPPHDPG